ncbi:antibiotic biosynthesis monooxygenase [Rhizobium sp. S152]|uniref:putative quinol monooxygenase n=1 Tax=Rhizobium sp. S152 TaxID=3055038 RepID=UPI0025A9DF09|nr:antibiotic biosynthesis monooxygenase [Rhizobium sp. S152]MDM9625752.1 antibiotic biosynthesis monooxygenase [Rhizobium sp. S152]
MSNVKIMAILTAKPGRTDELKALLATLAAASRAEEGNLRWDIWRDQANPDRFALDELYRNAAAVAAHRETVHYQNYLGLINDLADRTALLLDPVDAAQQ